MIPLSMYCQVGINTNSPHNSSAIEINSSDNNGGLLVPRMSLSEIDNISNPAESLIIYQNDLNTGFKYYDGCQWVDLAKANSPFEYNNNHIKYIAANEEGNYSVVIESSSKIISGLNWTRSGAVVNVSYNNHNLNIGDAVYIRNMNIENKYVQIIEVSQNSFTVETVDSGYLCGKNGAVQSAFSAHVTNDGYGVNENPYGNIDELLINKPSSAHDIILNSITIYMNDQTENFYMYSDNDYTIKNELDLFYSSSFLYNSSFPFGLTMSLQDFEQIEFNFQPFEEHGFIKLKN